MYGVVKPYSSTTHGGAHEVVGAIYDTVKQGAKRENHGLMMHVGRETRPNKKQKHKNATTTTTCCSRNAV